MSASVSTAGQDTSRRQRWPQAAGTRVAAKAGGQVALLLAFSSVILATNYALTGFPNVKLFDLLVFVAGYTLGFRRGAAVAVTTWAVYGTFNPWGATTPPLLATVTVSELVYPLAGAMLREAVPPANLHPIPGRRSLLLGTIAVACTLLYDAATNIYTGIAWAQLAGSSHYARWVITALFNPGALWFAAVHAGSNVAFFSLLGPALLKGTHTVKEHLPW